MSPPRARTTYTCLNFVNNQQRTHVLGQLAGTTYKFVGQRTNPSFALNDSKNTAAVVGVMASRNAPRSLTGTTLTPPNNGANGSCFAGCAVNEREPMVLPWKLPSTTTISVRPVSLESLSAASLASAPNCRKTLLHLANQRAPVTFRPISRKVH